jgi:serine/threonine-protein kinase
MLTGYPLLERVPVAWLQRVQLTWFLLGVSGTVVMAMRFGGLGSPYLQAVSVMIAFHGALFPAPWRRGLPAAMTLAVSFPLLIALVSLFDAPTRATLVSHAAWASFVLNYVSVLAMALIVPFSSHTAWAMRQQLYEARKLGRYRLKMRIGAGGSGEVWLASDGQRREVALKILRPDVAQRPGALARFEREAQAVRGFASPHTVRVFDFGGTDDGIWYLAMEYLAGADLRTLVEKAGPMAPARAVRLARQICASLAEAHERGVIHRDVKPENVIVIRDETAAEIAKVVDFGVAKRVDPAEDATLTQDGWIAGTPAYMAPETVSSGAADARSDLYALGGVLYFLLTGKPPFPANDAAAAIAAKLRDRPEPPSRRRGAPLPAALEAVVLRLLERHPQARYARAGDVDDALAAAMSASSS